ncbi:MAG: glycosyltransferase family 2 protein [Planctomycetota bacterium]
MILLAVCLFAMVAACIPAVMLLMNMAIFRPPPAAPRLDAEAPRPGVSLLIPARNEAASIERCLEAALASTGVDLEIVVLDDASTDGTAAIVQRLSAEDDRLRLVRNHELPDGWCGKQHACFKLAENATRPNLAWIDADVTLAPDALARMLAFRAAADIDLVSAFPKQKTHTLAEAMVVPLINFLLVGYLPMAMMRASRSDARFAVGCGQFMLADGDAYFAVGGHGHPDVRLSLHDGMTLPRAFRTAGRTTDIADGKAVATCRMYDSWSTVWNGFLKNATEGMATPVGIVVWTVLLGAAHVMPWALALGGFTGLIELNPLAASAVAASCIMTAAYSVAIATWFRQGVLSAIVRPAGVVMLLAIQWVAIGRKSLGYAPAWRGRSVASTS